MLHFIDVRISGLLPENLTSKVRLGPNPPSPAQLLLFLLSLWPGYQPSHLPPPVSYVTSPSATLLSLHRPTLVPIISPTSMLSPAPTRRPHHAPMCALHRCLVRCVALVVPLLPPLAPFLLGPLASASLPLCSLPCLTSLLVSCLHPMHCIARTITSAAAPSRTPTRRAPRSRSILPLPHRAHTAPLPTRASSPLSIARLNPA